MANWLSLANHVAGGFESFNQDLLGGEHGLAGKLRKQSGALALSDYLWSLGQDSTVEPDHGSVWKVEFAPPDDVSYVTEGADHGDTRALVLLG